MKAVLVAALAGVSVMGLAAPAVAQVADTAAQAATSPQTQADSTGVQPDSPEASVGDIVVTARRKSESLQNVPQTVTAVSGDTIKKLNLTQFQDIASVVPGLSLGNGNFSSGNAPAPSLRGVTFDSNTAASPTVDIYLNEVPVGADQAFQAIYDIGDVEVLRGPQGTLRGRTAPSGAITIGTRKADPSGWGGYVSGLGTEKGSINGQAAINAPIISDILAIRVAGLVDQNNGNFVHSSHGGQNPDVETQSGRANIAFIPASNFDAHLTYQYLHSSARQYTQEIGTGAPGGIVPGSSPPLAAPPAGYNGPTLVGADRLDPSDTPSNRTRRYHFVSGQVNWEVLGHRLSYVGGYVNSKLDDNISADAGNLFIGKDYYQTTRTAGEAVTQEVRLSSVGGKLIDYTLGYFYSHTTSLTNARQNAAFLPGSYGNPGGAPNPLGLNTDFALPVLVRVNAKSTENSFFGNATLHLGARTELSGGARFIIASVNNQTDLRLGAGQIALNLGAPCGAIGLPSTYPGFCNVPVPASTTPINANFQKRTDRPLVYNVSLSHRFSDTILAYATVGSSWRQGPIDIGLDNGGNDPVLAGLVFLKPERSTSYEVGFKTNFLDRRIRFNIAGFRQNFSNLIFRTQEVPYLDNNGATVQVNNFAFTANAKAIVTGFDVDTAFQVTPNWSISGAFSYADGHVDNDLVPCRDSNFDGQPDTGVVTVAQFQARRQSVAFCRTSQSVSRQPLWNATAQSELQQPIGQVQAYLRGLATINPSNTRQNIGYTVPAYALLNLYAGIRSPNGAWDVGVFARNITDNGVLLSREATNVVTGGGLSAIFGDSGYRFATYTPPREVGISVRYAFGTR